MTDNDILASADSFRWRENQFALVTRRRSSRITDRFAAWLGWSAAMACFAVAVTGAVTYIRSSPPSSDAAPQMSVHETLPTQPLAHNAPQFLYPQPDDEPGNT